MNKSRLKEENDDYSDDNYDEDDFDDDKGDGGEDKERERLRKAMEKENKKA